MQTSKHFRFSFVFIFTLSFNLAFGATVGQDEEYNSDLADINLEEEERLIIIPAITLNVSSLSSFLPIGLALATSVASLITTIALAAVVFSIFGKYKHDGGYGGSYSGYGNNAAYTSYNTASYRAFFDPSEIEWENLSIVDLIRVGEDIWKKFDPTDSNCQKRFICEIHQNTDDLGFAAERLVDLFQYLYYTKVMTLPEEMDKVIDEYLDAADKGADNEKDCEEFFGSCRFSLKKIVQKYGSSYTNNV